MQSCLSLLYYGGRGVVTPRTKQKTSAHPARPPGRTILWNEILCRAGAQSPYSFWSAMACLMRPSSSSASSGLSLSIVFVASRP